MRDEWEEPEDTLVAADNREAVYVGGDITHGDTERSVIIGDESEGEWLSIDRKSLPLAECI